MPAMLVMLQIGIALALLAAIVSAEEVGYRLGRRSAKTGRPPTGSQVSSLQAATLGLLALLLGFAFAGASGRFVDRQDLIVREANAIGSVRGVFDLAGAAERDRARSLLDEYVRLKLEHGRLLREGSAATIDLRRSVAARQAELWAVTVGVCRREIAVAPVIMPAVIQLIDIDHARDAATRRHAPRLVLGLLVACAALGIATLGFGAGLAGRRNLLLTAPLVLLIVLSLWTTIDLDYPRAGLIRVDDTPLSRLAGPGPG